MEPTACNYDPTANCPVDSDCCFGTDCGCTDPMASNYDPLAVCNEGCQYDCSINPAGCFWCPSEHGLGVTFPWPLPNGMTCQTVTVPHATWVTQNNYTIYNSYSDCGNLSQACNWFPNNVKCQCCKDGNPISMVTQVPANPGCSVLNDPANNITDCSLHPASGGTPLNCNKCDKCCCEPIVPAPLTGNPCIPGTEIYLIPSTNPCVCPPGRIDCIIKGSKSPIKKSPDDGIQIKGELLNEARMKKLAGIVTRKFKK